MLRLGAPLLALLFASLCGPPAVGLTVDGFPVYPPDAKVAPGTKSFVVAMPHRDAALAVIGKPGGYDASAVHDATEEMEEGRRWVDEKARAAGWKLVDESIYRDGGSKRRIYQGPDSRQAIVVFWTEMITIHEDGSAEPGSRERWATASYAISP